MTKHISLATISVFAALQLSAQTNSKQGVDTTSTKTLSEVTIKGNKSQSRTPVSIGKIAISPMDLPQSLTIIDHEVLKRQQALDVSDVLRNVNGVYIIGNTGGVQQEIAGRGFAFSSSNTFKNGIRFNNGIKPEISALEQVEVLKGTSAILFGNVAPGGVLNLVTKKPKFEKGGEVAMNIGSYDFYKPTFDVYGGIGESKTVAYRVNSSYEKARSFRDNVGSERFYVNPSLLIKAGDKVDVLLEGDYLKDNRTLDYGTGAINYVLADIPRNTFLGASWSYNKTEQMSGTATTTWHINKNWDLRNTSGAQGYNNELFGTTRPNASGNMVKDDGTWNRTLQRTAVAEEYYVSQLDLTGKFNTGSIKHTLLVGGDADRYFTQTTAYNTQKYDVVNVYHMDTSKQRTDIPTMTLNTTTSAPVSRGGAYVQDLISFTDKIKLLAGARYSYQQRESAVYYHQYRSKLDGKSDSLTKTTNIDAAVTPRFGLVYQPISNISLFASFAQSFTQNTGIDVNNNALAPSITDQYEAGWKNDLFHGLLSANLTVYQIISHNYAQNVLGNANPLVKELAGEITSKGLEVDLMSKLYKGFTVIAGYSYNETRYTKSNTYVVGSLLLYNPKNTANASVYYSFPSNSILSGFQAGVSGIYFGDRAAGRSTRLLLNGQVLTNDSYKPMPLPAYTQLDLSLGYVYQNLSVRVKCSNVFNVLSYNVHDDNSVNPIAPRMFMTTFGYKF